MKTHFRVEAAWSQACWLAIIRGLAIMPDYNRWSIDKIGCAFLESRVKIDSQVNFVEFAGQVRQ